MTIDQDKIQQIKASIYETRLLIRESRDVIAQVEQQTPRLDDLLDQLDALKHQAGVK